MAVISEQPSREDRTRTSVREALQAASAAKFAIYEAQDPLDAVTRDHQGQPSEGIVQMRACLARARGALESFDTHARSELDTEAGGPPRD